jgi:hypothetical protein
VFQNPRSCPSGWLRADIAATNIVGDDISGCCKFDKSAPPSRRALSAVGAPLSILQAKSATSSEMPSQLHSPADSSIHLKSLTPSRIPHFLEVRARSKNARAPILEAHLIQRLVWWHAAVTADHPRLSRCLFSYRIPHVPPWRARIRSPDATSPTTETTRFSLSQRHPLDSCRVPIASTPRLLSPFERHTDRL